MNAERLRKATLRLCYIWRETPNSTEEQSAYERHTLYKARAIRNRTVGDGGPDCWDLGHYNYDTAPWAPLPWEEM